MHGSMRMPLLTEYKLTVCSHASIFQHACSVAARFAGYEIVRLMVSVRVADTFSMKCYFLIALL